MRIFVIRARVDGEFTEPLRQQALAQFGRQWKFDPPIPDDPHWWPKARLGIRQSEAVLWIVSRASSTSRYCRDEAKYAVRRRRPLFLWYLEDVREVRIGRGRTSVVATAATDRGEGLIEIDRLVQQGRPS